MAANVTIKYAGVVGTYCSCDIPANTQIPIGETHTITVTFNRYYSAGTDGPRLEYRRYGELQATERFTRVDDKTWQLTTNFNPLGWINVAMTATVCTDVGDMKCYVENHLTNCTSSLNEGEYAAGALHIAIICANNYEFPMTPYIAYEVGAETITVEFDRMDDTTYVLDFVSLEQKTYRVYGEAVKKTIIADKYGVITAYRLTKNELKEIANKRWIERTWDPVTYEGVIVLYAADDKYIDTAKYVVSLFKLFIDVDVGDKEKLYFGPYDMDMRCDVIPTDVVTIDFGTVTITGRHGNAIDYENTEMDMYLPFIGFTSISVADFMDKTVRLQYQVNTLNGDALALLSCDGVVLFSQSCNVAMNIPYQLGANEYVNTSLAPNNTYIADTPPYILVKSKKAVMPDDSLPYKDTKFYARFGELQGYTQATEIDFEVHTDHITKTEIDEIISLLENGVFL